MLGQMHLVVGLGNPGPRYARTRHNIGFLTLDRLVPGVTWRTRGHALVARRNDTWLMKPTTFMNASGMVVAPFLRYYRIPAEALLVIHDDLDLPLGRLRLKADGSSGGQKGVASVHQALGDASFHRLRLGIGRPPPNVDVINWVLASFTEREEETLGRVLDAAEEAVRVWLELGLTPAQDRFNGLDLM